MISLDLIKYEIIKYLNFKNKLKILSLNKELLEEIYKKYYFDYDEIKNDINLRSKMKRIKYVKETKNLPSTITHLTFGYCFNQEVKKLPKLIKEINIKNCPNKEKLKNNIRRINNKVKIII